MTWPSFVTTRQVTSGPSYTLEDGSPLKTRLTVTASRSLVWDATGIPFTSEEHQVTSELGEQASLFLPVTDQAGWRDDQNNLIDVTAPDTFTHTYRIVRELLDEKNRVVKGSRREYLGVVVPTGVGAIDVDLMLPTETVEGARVSIPDTWSADVSAAAESAQVASDSATSAAEYASAAAEAAGDAAAAVAPVAASVTELETLTTDGRLGEAGLSATTEQLVDARVPGQVAAVIADDPTVAANAAALAQDDAGLVRTEDARLAQDIGALSGWRELVITRDGYVLSGVMEDGTVYNYFDTANPARTADPQNIPGYRNIVFDSTETYVVEADKTDGTKYFHRLSVDVLEAPDTAITRLAAVASFGDSMTGDHGNTGTSTGAYLGTVLGLPAFQGGVPGQTSTEAAFRAGGMEMWASVTGGVIPTSGGVAVEVAVPAAMWKADAAWTFAVTAHLEDGTKIAGTLVKAIGNTWTFTPTSLAEETEVPREMRLVSDHATANAQRGIIFRAGRNNLDQATIIRDYRMVRDWVYATQARPRFLALPLYNPATATAGTGTYDTYMAINEAIAEEMGADFYDLRRWFYKYGLSAAGITPTTQDLADIAADVVPTSLRYQGTDNTHLSPTGRRTEAAQIAHVITSKGWFLS